MRVRADVVSLEMTRNSERRMSLRNSHRIGDLPGYGLAPLGKQQRAVEIANSLMEDMNPAKQTKLTMQVAQLFGKFEAPQQRAADLVAVALGEHQRQSESCLEFHLAAAAAIGV